MRSDIIVSNVTTRRRQPPGGQAPVVQRVRLRYAKRGPLRFTSHRDVARALERALRRAGVPVAYSQGFTPHPRISYASAAPTGVASEAEYLEIALREPVDPAAMAEALDRALSPGLDVLEAVVAAPGTSLADRLEASHWRIELPGLGFEPVERAVAALLAAPELVVERTTRQGRRKVDIRAALVRLGTVRDPGEGRASGPATGPVDAPSRVGTGPCAILDCVVRQVTPAVRPDDVLTGLRVVAGLEPTVPARATRLAQGPLTASGEIADPLATDRDGAPPASAG